jgi:hypothetical protein
MINLFDGFHRWNDQDVEIISFGAQHFARAYYESYDNYAQRLEVSLIFPV